MGTSSSVSPISMAGLPNGKWASGRDAASIVQLGADTSLGSILSRFPVRAIPPGADSAPTVPWYVRLLATLRFEYPVVLSYCRKPVVGCQDILFSIAEFVIGAANVMCPFR